MSIINFINVSFSYPRAAGTFALDNINLTVDEGEFLAVMGENGAGKTTLCKLVNGIIPHSCEGKLAGEVIVDGGRTADLSVPVLASKVGMVFDDPDSQLFTSTVFQEAAFGPENLLLDREEIAGRVKSALCAVGLAGFEGRVPSTLSGGEKQRLSIAAALAMNGKILCLDEPLCRLDPDGAKEVISVLKNLNKKFNITIVMTTHDSEMALENADRVCILKKGRIAAIDTAQNFYIKTALLEENGIMPVNEKKPEPRRMRNNSMGTEHTSKVNAIDIKNFFYSYKDGFCIDNINLSFADNDFAAVMGNNGCGKSTLLKCVTGLLRPRSGDILIRGINVKKMTVQDISKEAGFVMQNPDAQLFTDSVRGEVSFALKNMRRAKLPGFNISNAEINMRVDDAITAAGLEGNALEFPHALNKTGRVKTVIACVLAMGCKIIILDEVDAGLDYNDSIKIMELARDLHSRGFTIIFVTHNIFLADKYAHRLIKMSAGRIVQDD